MAVTADERARFGARLRHVREVSRLCEVGFVLQGTIEVQVKDERFAPQPGDALTFGAAVAHTWRATSDGARVLWILAPGLPDPRAVAS